MVSIKFGTGILYLGNSDDVIIRFCSGKLIVNILQPASGPLRDDAENLHLMAPRLYRQVGLIRKGMLIQ